MWFFNFVLRLETDGNVSSHKCKLIGNNVPNLKDE